MNKSPLAPSGAKLQPFPSDIEKVTRPDGSVWYRYFNFDGESGAPREVPTCEMGLFEFFYKALERFQKLVDMMGGEAHAECGMLFEALIRDVRSQLVNAEVLVTSHIGVINCVVVDRGMVIPRPQLGRMIDVELIANLETDKSRADRAEWIKYDEDAGKEAERE